MDIIQHSNVLSAIGLGTLLYMGVTSLQYILFRTGYARGLEEGRAAVRTAPPRTEA